MTITSYAQNFEDVILWRALKHVRHGYYIDIGAQDPMIDSVSLAFYEQGWRGMHIEPTPYYADQIRRARPDEELIEAAISEVQGEIAFYEVPETGLSTGDEAIAQQHEANGYVVKCIKVPTLPLSRILNAQRDREIHWLKIDVEGMEEQVIASWHSSPVRPWIVLVESTKPTSSEVNFATWEPQLVALGYEYVYFDGLNRFYVSVNHPELKASFGPGANVFDDFVLSGLASAPFCHRINAEKEQLAAEAAQALNTARAEAAQALNTARAEAAQALNTARAEADFVRAERDAARRGLLDSTRAWEVDRASLMGKIVERDQALSSRETEIARRNQELAAVYRSTSWRVTAPLRVCRRGAGWFVRGASAWLTFKPNSRPHRTVTAMRALFGNTQPPDNPPPSADQGKPVRLQVKEPSVESLPSGSWRANDAIGSGLVVLDQLDTGGETQVVQKIYQQLRCQRMNTLKNK